MSVPTSKSKVCFFFQDVQIALRDRTRLKRFIGSIVSKEGKKLGSLNIIFCTDAALLAVNRQFLQHDYFTDIITFDLSGGSHIEAEIYISTDRVKDNARSLNVSVKSELHRVIFHGVLHLCGFGDKTKAAKTKMTAMENHYLNQYFR